jgi:hypothetical protein
MERELSADQLAEHWTLEAANWQWLANKTGATRLGFAALLKFFESEGRFPRNREELPPSAIHFWLNRFMSLPMRGASTAGKAAPSSITVLKSARH